MKSLFVLTLLVTLFLTAPQKAYAQQFYTVPEVLAQLFPTSDSVGPQKQSLSASQIQTLKTRLQTAEVKKDWTVYVATTGKTIDGFAVIDNVMGKERPITYVVSISPAGAVNAVEIIEYRESHGGEIKNAAFRRQFIGKTAADPLKVTQDIRHVSGATISSKSIAFGVKRALAVWQVLHEK